jgi:hypothetical protein
LVACCEITRQLVVLLLLSQRQLQQLSVALQVLLLVSDVMISTLRDMFEEQRACATRIGAKSQ